MAAHAVHPATNAQVAALSAPQISVDDWTQAHARYTFQVSRASGGALDGHMYSSAGWRIEPDYTKYSLIRVDGGTGQIFGLNYLGENGRVIPYPTTGYEVIGNTLIIYPTNRTEPFCLWMKFNGTTYSTVKTGSTREEIVPPQDARPEFEWLGATPYTDTGGWGEYVSQWPYTFDRTGSFNANFNVRNTGLSSITFSRLEVHVGAQGTEADPVTYTLNDTRSLPPGALLSVTLPAAMPPSGFGQTVTIVGVTPAGEHRVLTKTGFSYPQPADGSGWSDRRIARIAGQNLEARASLAKHGIVLSDATVALYQSVVQQFGATGTIVQADRALVTGAPIPPPSVRNSLIVEAEGKTLEEAYYAYLRAKGRGEIEASTDSHYLLRSLGANADAVALKYGLTYDGTTNGFLELMRKIEGIVRGQTQAMVASGTASSVVVPATSRSWDEEVIGEIGGGSFIADIPKYLESRFAVPLAQAAHVVEVADAVTTSDQAMQYLQSCLSLSGALPSYSLRTDTVLSRAFLGMYRMLDQYASSFNAHQKIGKDPRLLDYVQTAKAIELLTGIKWLKVLSQISYAESLGTTESGEQWISNQLRTLFSTAHYDHLFQRTPSIATTEPQILHVMDATDYMSNPSFVRLRYDVRLPQTYTMHHLTAYVIDGEKQLAPELSKFNGTKLFIDVPLANINNALQEVPMTRPEQVAVKFKLAGWFSQSQNQSLPLKSVGATTESSISIHYSNFKQLSNSTDPERQKLENAILNALINRFPVDNPASWEMDLGSPAHQHNGLNAGDLNNVSGDLDKPVYASKNGVVMRNNLDTYGNSTVVIRYQEVIDGAIKEWYATYLHMDNRVLTRNGVVMDLTPGVEVLQGDQIGTVASIGPKSTGPHLHFEVSLSNYGSGPSENLAVLCKELGIKVTATTYGIDQSGNAYQVGNSKDVAWVPEIQMWATATLDSQKHEWNPGGEWLLFDQSEQNVAQRNGTPTYWLAWETDNNGNSILDPSLLKRAKYVKQLPDGRIVNSWYSLDLTKSWNSSSRKWE